MQTDYTWNSYRAQQHLPARLIVLGTVILLFSITSGSYAAVSPPVWNRTWGTYGSGNGQFYSPQGVAVDASGNVYVADTSNHRIQKFDSAGGYLTQWGTYGSENGQFYSPQGVAVGASGNVYVADTSNHRIQKFTSAGVYLTQWGTSGTGNGQFDSPYSVAVDASGNVYVADTYNSRIQKFTSAGVYLTKWGTYGSGNGQFDYPSSVAVNASGSVYVADTSNYRIQKFTSAGGYLAKWGTYGSGNGQFDSPNSVAVDANGNVYVVDTSNYRIQMFTSAGAYVTQWGASGDGNGKFIYPKGVAVDASGSVYIADTDNHRIQQFEFMNCDAAPAIIAGVPIKSTTVGAPAKVARYAGVPAGWLETRPEKVYQVYIPVAGVLTAMLSGVATTTNLDIFLLNVCRSSAAIASGESSATIDAAAGTYYVVVDGKGGTSGGAFTLTVDAPMGYDNWSSWMDGRKVTAGEVAMTTFPFPSSNPAKLFQAIKGTDGYVWTRYSADGFTWYPWDRDGDLSADSTTAGAKAAGRVEMLYAPQTQLLCQAIRATATTTPAFSANAALTRCFDAGNAKWGAWGSSPTTPAANFYKIGGDVTMAFFGAQIYQAARAAATNAPFPVVAANTILTRSFSITWDDLSSANSTPWSKDDENKKAMQDITMLVNAAGIPGSTLYQAAVEAGTYKVLTRFHNGGGWQPWQVDASIKATGSVALAEFEGDIYQAIRQYGTNIVWSRSCEAELASCTEWHRDPYNKAAASNVKLFAFDMNGDATPDRLYRAINSGGKALTQYTTDGTNWTPWVADGVAISPNPITMEAFDPSGANPRLYQATKGTLNKVWTRYTNADEIVMAPNPQPTPQATPAQTVAIRKTGTGNGIVTVGTWICPLSCQELQIPVLPGVTLSASATPDDGSTFVGWQKLDGEALTGLEYVQPGETVFAMFKRQ